MEKKHRFRVSKTLSKTYAISVRERKAALNLTGNEP